MSNRILAQEEIEALLKQSEGFALNHKEKDALGEVGNISMGSAATTLSEILGKKVLITSPKVKICTAEELYEEFTVPRLMVKVKFKEGLVGFNLLIMKINDAVVLADLMMGGDGTKSSEKLTEMEMSAASEAMNQMIGTASTSLASLFKRAINIYPPESFLLDKEGDVDYRSIIEEDNIVKVEFNMTIGNLLDTQIMQIMGLDTAKEKAQLLLGDVEERSEDDGDDKDVTVGLPDSALPAASDTGTQRISEDMSSRRETWNDAEDIESGGVNGRFQASSAGQPVQYDKDKLDLLLDIPLKVTVVLGRTKRPIKDVLNLTSGSIVELAALVDEPVEVQVNGTLVAKGEVVVVNENFGVRITEILSPAERLQQLKQ